MDQLIEFAMFSGKVIILVVGFLIVLSALAGLALKNKPEKEKLDVQHLNKKFKKYTSDLNHSILDKKALKKKLKADKKAKSNSVRKKVYLISFVGDKKASTVDKLADEISAVLTVATSNDEIVVKVESPGGYVHTYGLAAAQLERIRTAGIPLTICVDKVAASGGYLMACTGDKILSAPFAIVGSIGVLAQVPNFNKILKKNDIEWNEITAGEYKRSVSIFGETTEKGLKKFTEDIENTHGLFKNFVSKYRSKLDISKVATGEVWYGIDAINNGLVDEIMTSDQYLLSKVKKEDIYSLKIEEKKSLSQKLTGTASALKETLLENFSINTRA